MRFLFHSALVTLRESNGTKLQRCRRQITISGHTFSFGIIKEVWPRSYPFQKPQQPLWNHLGKCLLIFIVHETRQTCWTCPANFGNIRQRAVFKFNQISNEKLGMSSAAQKVFVYTIFSHWFFNIQFILSIFRAVVHSSSDRPSCHDETLSIANVDLLEDNITFQRDSNLMSSVIWLACGNYFLLIEASTCQPSQITLIVQWPVGEPCRTVLSFVLN